MRNPQPKKVEPCQVARLQHRRRRFAGTTESSSPLGILPRGDKRPARKNPAAASSANGNGAARRPRWGFWRNQGAMGSAGSLTGSRFLYGQPSPFTFEWWIRGELNSLLQLIARRVYSLCRVLQRPATTLMSGEPDRGRPVSSRCWYTVGVPITLHQRQGAATTFLESIQARPDRFRPRFPPTGSRVGRRLGRLQGGLIEGNDIVAVYVLEVISRRQAQSPKPGCIYRRTN